MQDETRNTEMQEAPIIGTPEEDAGTWDGEQSYPDTCAIRCQEFIIEQFTGQEVDETALIREAHAAGLYAPGQGTLPEDTGALLEMHGIPITQYANATPYHLADELAQGHKVIIGVDSGELVGGEDPVLQDILTNADMDGPDHAVVVSGIDTTDPNNPQVIISDPGTGEEAATYPLDQFLAAWQDSEFFMAATQDPVPPTAPEMVNFDYDEGHIPEVVGVPYEEFVTLQDQVAELSELLNQVVQAPPEPADQSMVDQILVDQAPPEPSAVDPGMAVPETDAGVLPLYEPPTAADAPGPGGDPALLDPAIVPDPTVLEPTIDPALIDPTLPGPTLDPALFDPTAPGPTLDPALFDPAAPGPTVDPALLDPTLPGPTLDPALLDPNDTGCPYCDPALLDPTAPGPTLDPALLDPTLPGPNVDPALLDPTVPGPTVDPSTLDPRTPGEMMDPSALDPATASQIQDIRHDTNMDIIDNVGPTDYTPGVDDSPGF